MPIIVESLNQITAQDRQDLHKIYHDAPDWLFAPFSGEAQLIEDSVRRVWRNGWRTAELAEPGCKIAGTRQFGELVAGEICNAAIQDEACSVID